MGGGGDVAFDGKMTEECFDFWNAHFLWVAFIVKQYVTPDPLDVGFFCTIRVMFQANLVANLL